MSKKIRVPQIFLTVFILAMNCSGIKKTQLSPLKGSIPNEISTHFKASMNSDYTLSFSSRLDELHHSDLSYLGAGVVESRHYGWRYKFKYLPLLVYENDNYYLFLSGSQIDNYRVWTKVLYYWDVIDKRTGKLGNSLVLQHDLFRPTVLGQYLYFKLKADSPDIFRMRIGKKEE